MYIKNLCRTWKYAYLYVKVNFFKIKDLLNPGIENGGKNNGRKKKKKHKFSIKFKKLEKKLLAMAGTSITFSSQDRFLPVTKR